ncbi:MAG: serine hydrolase domain-containing protein [Vicinamibacteraceae bacterium]
MTRKEDLRRSRRQLQARVRLWSVVAVVAVAPFVATRAVMVRADGQAASASRQARAENQPRPPEGTYFPARGTWRRVSPETVGMDKAALDRAIAYAVAHENPGPKDLALDRAASFGKEPFDEAVGPMRERAALNGVIVRHGSIVAEWGETSRADMTFSVTKSFLSTVVGLAWQQGLIRDLKDRVVDYMPTPELFETPHNAKITWDHLLRQTSDWRGTLWDKPDWADRPEGEQPSDYPNQPLHEPGTRYEYNDARVNLLALAALHVWRTPLPQVLREQVMDPIGASNTWRWHGYRNSWIELDGQRMQSVAGGGHWGGGMFISARDMLRFGYLFLRNGRWGGREIVSDEWIRMARTPGPANPTYGFMNWFLNTDRKPLPSAPPSAVTFRGSGNNIIYIDWEHDLVLVVRWIQGDALDSFLGQVLAAVRT